MFQCTLNSRYLVLTASLPAFCKSFFRSNGGGITAVPILILTAVVSPLSQDYICLFVNRCKSIDIRGNTNCYYIRIQLE